MVTLLAKSPMEMEAVYYCNYPNYPKNFPFALNVPTSYPLWRWDDKDRVFTRGVEVNELNLREKGNLARAKCYVLGEMGKTISRCRYGVWREILLQETVYMTKKLQAQAFKDKKYPQKDLLRYPYVLQYAEVSGLKPKAAADEILFKAQLDDELLCKTETLRLRYFGQVRDATTSEAVKKAFDEFRLEVHKCTLPITVRDTLRGSNGFQA